MRQSPRLVIAAFCLLSITGAAQAQTNLNRRDIIKNLSIPVEVLWGKDEWLWVLELGGRVLRVDPSTLESREVFTVPAVYMRGESGALGMALHPDSNFVFIAFNYFEDGEARLKLVRYRYDGDGLVEPRVLVQRISAYIGLTGGRLLITRDKKLMMTVGDLQINSLAQSPWYLNGKTLRMNLDGSAPTDNPYPRAATPLNLVWTSGHRDGRGLATTPGGVVFEAEQGRDSVDELNVLSRRRNYGWPRVVGNCDAAAESRFCTDSAVVPPVRLWRAQIFPGSLDYYDSPAIPEWRGSLLMPTLDQMDLRIMKVSGSTITAETVAFDEEFGRIRDVCVAPDGRIFVATSNRDEKGIPIAKVDDDRIVEIGGNVAIALLGTPAVTGDVGGVLRAGDSVVMTFAAQNFAGGNSFLFELSDASGSFAQPVVLRLQSGTDGGVLRGIIPCSAVAGSGYRFRVRTSNPARTKLANGTYQIIPAPAARIDPATPIQFCPGDSAVLRGTPGGLNLWSTGQRGDSIVVKQAGSYWVALVTNGCAKWSDTVQVSFSPVPSPAITHLGGNLLDAGAGFTRYEWYLDDTLLTETARSVIARRSGRYRVRVLNGSGCWGESLPFDHDIVTGVGGEIAGSGTLIVAPHPVRSKLSCTITVPAAGQLNLVLIDLRGHTVRRLSEHAAPGLHRRDIDVSGIPAGSYLLRVWIDDREIASRTVVKE